MVLLTITPVLLVAIEEYNKLTVVEGEQQDSTVAALSEPEVGKPISHAQVLNIAKRLRETRNQEVEKVSCRLNELLRGTSVYIAPPKPKIEKTVEYKELMARLRREEEARQYNAMTNPQPDHGPAITSPSFDTRRQEEEEMTYADVNRQMTLIFNVIVTIVACGVSIWLIARHFSAPTRLALSMGGAALVGVAEVVIYAGYLRRMLEAKTSEKKKKEVKTISETWTTVGGGKRAVGQAKVDVGDKNPRLRKPKT